MSNTQKLLTLAAETSKNAHCPYSGRAVGAAVLATDGKFYAGCNVENVSFPIGTCAESGAIAAMVAGGSRKIAEILVYTDGPKPLLPCGACRQRIAEFADPKVLIHAANSDGIRQTYTLDELLPHCFSEF